MIAGNIALTVVVAAVDRNITVRIAAEVQMRHVALGTDDMLVAADVDGCREQPKLFVFKQLTQMDAIGVNVASVVAVVGNVGL